MIKVIEGTITTTDGVTRSFMISADGYSQWGAGTEQLGDTVDALTAITEVLREDDHLETDNEGWEDA